MARQLTPKARERWGSLSGHIASKMCGAEAAGLLDTAEEFEGCHDSLETEWPKNNSTVQNQLYRYFGAPEGSVDLQTELNKPAYRRHLTSPLPSATPRALRRYIKARDARETGFEKWNPLGIHPEALVQKVTCLAKSSSGPRKDAFDRIMSARKKEIRALNQAIERCCVEGLATTRSASKYAQGFLINPRFIPWQLGHVYLLRDLVFQDLETTAEQREGLTEVIVKLKIHQSEA